MSELLSKVAELLNAPESLVQRSAEARAEASGRTVDEVLQSWAGGESVASVEKPAEEAPPGQVESADHCGVARLSRSSRSRVRMVELALAPPPAFPL